MLRKLCINLDGIWYAVRTGGLTDDNWFCKKKKKKKKKRIDHTHTHTHTHRVYCWLAFQHLWTDFFFQTRYDDRHPWPLHFHTTLTDINLSLLVWESNKLHLFSLNFFQSVWIKYSMLPQPVQVNAKSILANEYSKERTLLRQFYKYTSNTGLSLHAYEPI